MRRLQCKKEQHKVKQQILLNHYRCYKSVEYKETLSPHKYNWHLVPTTVKPATYNKVLFD